MQYKLRRNRSRNFSIIKWLKKIYSSKYKIWLKGYSAAGTTCIAVAAIDKNVDGIAIGGCVGLASQTILKRGLRI